MIRYQCNLNKINPDALRAGFFVGWGRVPSPEQHFDILRGSQYLVLACDDEQVIGFINALSDGILSAFIPLLEVLPAYQGQGIGSELVRRMLAQLDHLYSIDLICDADLNDFYARFDLQAYNAMIRRKRDWG